MLSIHSISAAYPNTPTNQPVLVNVSLRLEPGQVMALIGPNGAGKSTLIKTMSGQALLLAGSIRVEGQDLLNLTTRQRARLVAFVPQAIQLPPAFTAWETVLLGRTAYLNWLGQSSREDEKRVRDAMERTRTIELADRPVGNLSGGEQQRVLLARALAQATPILVMDEPTAHLDLKYQLDLLEMVTGLARTHNIAVLIALHDLNLAARFATHITLLVKGQVRAVGIPDEVLTPDTLSAAYNLPLDVLKVKNGSTTLITPAIP